VDFVGDSAEEIENLCIVSNRNGEERKLDAKYDPQSKSWIATEVLVTIMFRVRLL